MDIFDLKAQLLKLEGERKALVSQRKMAQELADRIVKQQADIQTQIATVKTLIEKWLEK